MTKQNAGKAAQKQAIKLPQILKDDALATFIDELEDEVTAESFIAEGGKYDNVSAKDASFGSGKFVQCMFAQSELPKLRLNNVEILQSDASNGDWESSKFARSRFNACKLVGTNLRKSQWTDVTLDNCKLDLLQLHGSKLSSVEFRASSLRKADFRACQMTDVSFIECDLEGAEFYGCKLENVKFRGSQIKGVKMNVEDLKGAVVDQMQLMELSKLLAETLGITVESE